MLLFPMNEIIPVHAYFLGFISPFIDRSCARLLKLEEIEMMWKIGETPHCIKLFNAWEQHGYLYMQTEFCAQGRYNTLR